MQCLCDYEFDFEYRGVQYSTLRRYRGSDGAPQLDLDHGADLYCVHANAQAVWVGGDRSIRDGATARKYNLDGALLQSLGITEGGASVRSLAVDASSNLYTYEIDVSTLETVVTQSAGSGVNQIYRLRRPYQFSGFNEGGTFRLQFQKIVFPEGGFSYQKTYNYTVAIASDADPEDIEDALEALPEIGAGNVSCSGSMVFGIDIEFVGDLAGEGFLTAFELGLPDQTETLVLAVDQPDHAGVTLRKYNSSGVQEWTAKPPGPGTIGGVKIAVDSSGNVYVAGALEGTLGRWGTLTKYDADGDFQWVRGAKPGNAVATDGTDVFLNGAGVGDPLVVRETFLVELTGGATGGTWTITVDSQTTGNIPYNFDAQDLTDALSALSNVVSVGVDMDQPGTDVGPVLRVTITGTDDARTNFTSITADGSLTGGSSPDVTITKLLDGDDQADGARSGSTACVDAAGDYQWSDNTTGRALLAYDPLDDTLLAAEHTGYDLVRYDPDGTIVWSDNAITQDLFTWASGVPSPPPVLIGLATGADGDFYLLGGEDQIVAADDDRNVLWRAAGQSSRGISWDGQDVWVCGARVQIAQLQHPL